MKKIYKFNEKVEEDIHHLIIEEDNYDNYYLFKTEESAKIFVLKVLYEKFKTNEKILDELEEINTLEEAIEHYDDYQEIYFGINVINHKEVVMNTDEVELPEWAIIRKETNKFNL